MIRATGAVCALALSLGVAGSYGCPPGGSRGKVVVFAFDKTSDSLRVLVADSETVQLANQYIATKKGAHIPTGPIRIGAGADPRYPFHFVPDSVRLAEVTMELCDGALMRTEAEVRRFIQGAGGSNSARWCPWAAFPVAVE
jgi:hypothetical protein